MKHFSEVSGSGEDTAQASAKISYEIQDIYKTILHSTYLRTETPELGIM